MHATRMKLILRNATATILNQIIIKCLVQAHCSSLNFITNTWTFLNNWFQWLTQSDCSATFFVVQFWKMITWKLTSDRSKYDFNHVHNHIHACTSRSKLRYACELNKRNGNWVQGMICNVWLQTKLKRKEYCLPNSSNTNMPPLLVPHFLILLSSIKYFEGEKRTSKGKKRC